MLFNSLEFVLFLPLVFGLYWAVGRIGLRAQNLLLWAAGYVFYGWWDWRFLLLLAASTLIDFVVAQQIDKHEADGPRKRWLAVSLVAQLGMLGIFKYYDFFVTSWAEAWGRLGVTMDVPTLKIILPVGISFYTFQTLSYVLDVYRGKLAPSKDLISFGAFISFFPQLMAGPIERATAILPQFTSKRTFNYEQAMQGLRLIIWGFFKKVAVADMCGTYVNVVFDNPLGNSSLTLAMAAFVFAVQIYGDFSGYSDIAIGAGKLLGFELMSNFRFPYFSRSVSEFWKRWHISLSTWFQDYLFMPLAIQFRQMRKWGVALAVFCTFLVSGIWHGANWTFIVWGAIHGCLLAAEQGVRAIWPRALPEAEEQHKWSHLPLMGLTMLFWALSLIFFRARSLAEAALYFQELGSLKSGAITFPPSRAIAYVVIMFVLDWIYRKDERSPLLRGLLPRWGHQLMLLLLSITVLRFIFSNEASFIYFQF